MATITEDYVSFETAKLLKEKGFNELTIKAYPCFEGKDYKYDISCPTLQMAMKWLREVHNIHIVIDYSKIFKKYSFDIPEVFGIIDDFSYDTYEQTCEVAIKYCLEKLIK